MGPKDNENKKGEYVKKKKRKKKKSDALDSPALKFPAFNSLVPICTPE